MKAVLHHPVAYLQHRASFMWQFLARQNLTMWTVDIENPTQVAHRDSAAFMHLKALHDWLAPTVLFRAGVWLLANLLLVALAWPRRETPEGAFGFYVCGSAIIYVATYFVFGVAADFRYAYWAVLAALGGAMVVGFARSRETQS
jgi:hypothetical protein